jgi:L,D-transpeptidase catalytic domain
MLVLISSYAYRMNSKAFSLVALFLSILVGGCSNQPAVPTVSTVTTNDAQNRVERSGFYLPPTGQWTVRDVLQAYGKNAVDKLDHYFTKVKVTYPPREVALIAYKQEKKLELWARDKGEFRLIRDYFIMAASGDAGPKLRQGDRQVPEGIYRITKLNPNSHFHLSMEINYPNAFDLIHAELDGRTDLGSDIFIHGKDASIGCLAMGDAAIRELFVLAAQVGVANVKVVIAPHDPKAYPLAANSEELPEWTSELYAMISREIEALSHGSTLSAE